MNCSGQALKTRIHTSTITPHPLGKFLGKEGVQGEKTPFFKKGFSPPGVFSPWLTLGLGFAKGGDFSTGGEDAAV
jgi:hypothetical protein